MKFAMYAGFSKKVIENGIEDAAKYALQLGFSSVEFLANSFCEEKTPILDLASAKMAREVLDQYQLPVACYSVFSNLWKNPDGEKYLMKQVEIAAALGAPYLHHTLLPWISLPEDAPGYGEAIEETVKAAARIADYANTFGITCIYEDQGYYVNGVEGFKGFWDKMKERCENIGICGDLGNILFVNEKPQDFLAAYIKDICHVHVKDYLWKKSDTSPGRYWTEAKDNSWLRDTMIGDGVIDFEICMNILKNAGYQGYFSLENTHPEPYEEGVQQAMECLQRYW
ncbi:MAG: sugar phosphate isomerase/epimerase [Roseburia sp.]|nr:sugar phosphate isomerase/epimerase [Roseburia sp.]